MEAFGTVLIGGQTAGSKIPWRTEVIGVIIAGDPETHCGAGSGVHLQEKSP
jgi:hypothetical protein